jgi:multidrug efflux pump subunit AcrA (membrane-fusion protein)
MIPRIAKVVVTLCILGSLTAAAALTRARWLPIILPPPATADEHDHNPPPTAPEGIELSDLAQQNLKVVSQPLKAVTDWTTITVPGIIIDRPGSGDRGVVAPVTGVVKQIHRVAGEWPKPGEPLVTMAILSETLHQMQTDLFKATQDRMLAEAQKTRLAKAGVAEARLIDVDQQLTRLDTVIRAYRQDLLNRGLTVAQIDAAAGGTFLSEMTIGVPSRRDGTPVELQEIKVELGQQVAAGQTLAILANHRVLSIEGRAFADETALIARSLANGWPVQVDFGEPPGSDWPAPAPAPIIASMSNVIDPESRTFAFQMPFENQAKAASVSSAIAWRFRPGQRVRLTVRVAERPNVFVLPVAAVARDGGEWIVFRQNGDRFDRKPVLVLDRTRDKVVIANDGQVPPGVYVAQAGATEILRMIKAQSAPADPHAGHEH